MGILLSLSSTPMALYSYVTFAAAALADNGVGQQQRLEMAAVSERLFQLRHRRRQRGRRRSFSRHTGDDSLADTAEAAVRPVSIL